VGEDKPRLHLPRVFVVARAILAVLTASLVFAFVCMLLVPDF